MSSIFLLKLVVFQFHELLMPCMLTRPEEPEPAKSIHFANIRILSQQDAPLMALHGMLNVAPIIPHCMFRRYLKNILPWPLK